MPRRARSCSTQSCLQPKNIDDCLASFRAPKKSSFFSCGATPSRTVPKTCRSPFLTRKSRSEVPERGDFGEEDCLGKGGVDGAKKGKKDVKKKVGCSSPITPKPNAGQTFRLAILAFFSKSFLHTRNYTFKRYWLVDCNCSLQSIENLAIPLFFSHDAITHICLPFKRLTPLHSVTLSTFCS